MVPQTVFLQWLAFLAVVSAADSGPFRMTVVETQRLCGQYENITVNNDRYTGKQRRCREKALILAPERSMADRGLHPCSVDKCMGRRRFRLSVHDR